MLCCSISTSGIVLTLSSSNACEDHITACLSIYQKELTFDVGAKPIGSVTLFRHHLSIY